MNMTRDRVQSIGWFTLLSLCAVLTGSLMLRVNAVKSQVEISQRQIVALERENQFLATEYETRANQQQLSAINDLDFGYKAPDAAQYLESERQLAMLGKPRAPDAPQPIEVASADPDNGGYGNRRSTSAGNDSAEASAIPASLTSLVPQLTSRLISRAMAAPIVADVPRSSFHGALDAANLRERLARIDPPVHSE